MKLTLKTTLFFVIFTLWVSTADGQTPQPAPAAPGDCLKGAVKDLRDVLNRDESQGDRRPNISSILQRWTVYLCYQGSAATRLQLLGRAEVKRMDKQPGAGNTAAGTTSLVSKGSAPSLIGFALEHGGLTQDVEGNTITFRGNLINSIRALQAGTYLGSFDLGQDDPLVAYLAKLSFGVSFDTSLNQGSSSGFSFNRNTFSGATAKYELYNHRDPRDKKWRSMWKNVSDTAGMDLARSFTGLDAAIPHDQAFNDWLLKRDDIMLAIPRGASPQQDLAIQNALEDTIKSFISTFGGMPEVKSALDRFTAAIPTYFQAEETVFAAIKRTPIVTFDGSFVRQSIPTNPTITATQPVQGLPDLLNMTLVLERGFAGDTAPELTFNASGTWFTGSSAGGGRIRDYRASLQMDIPLKEIQQIGTPTLSFSGQYLHLLQEPLGQMVTVNGVTISRTGGIGVFQTKLSVPVKDSGIKIPISFTYSNRTELIKETDVRGNIGVTFDLDSLFAKSK
jgi:hypothetical protein